MLRNLSLFLALIAALLPATRAAADEVDGLDATAKQVFYQANTVFVARTEMAGLQKDQVDAALRGMIYESRLGKFKIGDLTNSADQGLDQPRMLALAGFTHVTTVGLDRGGGDPVLYHIVQLGPKLQDDTNFNLWKFGLSGLAKGTDVTRLGANAVFHPAGTQLPAATGYSRGIEESVRHGLGQPPQTATIRWVLLPRDAVRDTVKALLGDRENWAALTSDVSGANYVGGYVETGARPEFEIFIRFGAEAKASAMKQAYDAAWQKEQARAAAADQEARDDIARRKSKGLDTSAEEARLAKYPPAAETARRISTALPGQAFGQMFLLRLRQNELRELTAALQDAWDGIQ